MPAEKFTALLELLDVKTLVRVSVGPEVSVVTCIGVAYRRTKGLVS